MFRACLRTLVYTLVLTLGLSMLAFASDTPERFQMNRDIRIEPGDKTGDVSCLNCSVYVRGQVTGDVFALHGNVVVESGGAIAGDVSTLAGDVRMESGSSISGSVAAIAGTIKRQPQAQIGGDSSAMEGLPWLLLLIMIPVVLFASIVALILWLVHRMRRPAHAMA